MDVCDAAIRRMGEALHPGMTDNQLWAILHEVNIAHHGEWIESRLLSSGERTNPWFQERGPNASGRSVQAGSRPAAGCGIRDTQAPDPALQQGADLMT